MKKLLIMGINTRGLVNSCLKLPYKCYSVSYYFTCDFKHPFKEKHILNQVEEKSCGFFEENYSPEKLLELSLDYMDEVDTIILSSGISPSDFKGKFKKYKKKILGNTDIKDIEDKYKFYKKIKNKFLTSKTFKVRHGNNEDNIHETLDILKENKNKFFIIKPLQGSGGYGVKYLKYNENYKLKTNNSKESIYNNYFLEYEKTGFIIQEYIEGTNISSSILSTKNESKTIVTSKMLIESDFGLKNSFRYCGNIVPFESDNINNIKIISQDLISQLKLIGSNGIDMILNNKHQNKREKDQKSENNEDVYIIEVNPRFQGTYECVEEVLGINLLEAHIKACAGELIDIPTLKKDIYSMKRLIYSDNRLKIGNIKKNHDIYDIPFKGVIIEKNEPLVSIITPKKDLKMGKKIIEKKIIELNDNIKTLN
ncbi:hypothetical protein ALNOE001_04540 [Candidatus Methanobinarius endosymbioticus]|uniref:ATP-grasp domain-containing protein n=1 Tax=Candidatus Methanobinarius endosymbioticus TaxID=2006182 RepID=A0A366MF55_9EURY|nr:hypothetical protein ALNOE001_04540 [Candidatus Methanobinarius endosymbioticus]